ncbi:MAG: HD domain-containing protein [Gammaproteobacteria bacterium]|nr:HD domain-containing protein [Gammaproteobacteria bacterium]
MQKADIESRLKFLRAAERLKDTLRSAHTTGGRTESVADHSWRLTLLAITLADSLPDIDLLRLLKICVLHDLGEAVDGDIPAPLQDPAASKSAKERSDFLSLVAPLPDRLRTEFVSLWDEYENVASPEAKVAKALDKLETILQHNQGANPAGFDYAFNLGYGRACTDAVPLAAQIRKLLDEDTRENAGDRAEDTRP